MKQFLVLVLLVSFGCAKENDDASNVFSNKKVVEVDFSKTYRAQGTKVDVDMYGATDISIKDSLLIVSTPQLNHLYRIISIDSQKTLAQIATKGRAANELTEAFAPMYYTKKDNEISMTIHDYIENVVKHINLTRSVNDSVACIDAVRTLNMSTLAGLYTMHQIGDSIYFVDYMNMQTLNQEYAFFNSRINSKETLPLTIDGGGLENIGNCYYLAGATTIDLNRGKYVCAMKFVDQINILDLYSPDNSFSVSTAKSRLGFASLLKEQHRAYYYLDTVLSGDYIIGLYVGSNDSNYALHIFNWQGNAICNIELGLPIERIEIDDRTNAVYGITVDEQLFRYDINQYLEQE